MIESKYLEYQKKKCKKHIKDALSKKKMEDLQNAADIKKELIGYQDGLKDALEILETYPFPKEAIQGEIENTKEVIIELFENI